MLSDGFIPIFLAEISSWMGIIIFLLFSVFSALTKKKPTPDSNESDFQPGTPRPLNPRPTGGRSDPEDPTENMAIEIQNFFKQLEKPAPPPLPPSSARPPSPPQIPLPPVPRKTWQRPNPKYSSVTPVSEAEGPAAHNVMEATQEIREIHNRQVSSQDAPSFSYEIDTSNRPVFNQNAPAHDQNAPVFSYEITEEQSTRPDMDWLRGRTNLRRAFIAREILDRPVSQR